MGNAGDRSRERWKYKLPDDTWGTYEVIKHRPGEKPGATLGQTPGETVWAERRSLDGYDWKDISVSSYRVSTRKVQTSSGLMNKLVIAIVILLWVSSGLVHHRSLGSLS